MTNLTSLGEKNEKALLDELRPIIEKWANKTHNERQYIEKFVAFMWEYHQQQVDDEVDRIRSANSEHLFGGR